MKEEEVLLVVEEEKDEGSEDDFEDAMDGPEEDHQPVVIEENFDEEDVQNQHKEIRDARNQRQLPVRNKIFSLIPSIAIHERVPARRLQEILLCPRHLNQPSIFLQKSYRFKAQKNNEYLQWRVRSDYR